MPRYNPPQLKFEYTNWRDECHEYVIEVDPRPDKRLTHRDGKWWLNGDVVTRDGDGRSEMGPTRRRSFELTKMRNIEGVPDDSADAQ